MHTYTYTHNLSVSDIDQFFCTDIFNEILSLIHTYIYILYTYISTKAPGFSEGELQVLKDSI